MVGRICLFCDGAPENRRVTASRLWLSVWDGYPVVGGHALLVPRRHIKRLFELDRNEWEDLWRIIIETGIAIDAQFKGVEGYNFGINDGGVAGQAVEHLHIHVFPRRPNDVDDPRGGVRNMFPNAPQPWEKN